MPATVHRRLTCAKVGLEGRRPLDTLHIPYFDFIEQAEASTGRLPRDREIVVLCAQGGSSALVVDMLRETGIAARNVAGGMVAYGEYLQPVKVPLPGGADHEIWQVNRRGKGCLSYVIRAGRQALVVDASRDAEWYERFLGALGAELVHVLDTHVHADHVSGGPALAARAGVPYFVNAGPAFELRHRAQALADGQHLELGGQAGVTSQVRFLATPGHTPGSSSYLVGDRHLLTGDTLFVKSVGRPDLGGHVVEWGRALFHTLRKRLASLGDETVVLPAHFAAPDEIGPDGVVSARLGDLRRALPEFLIENEDAFIAAMQAAVKPPPPSYAEIIRVNLGLTTVAPDQATEWELGKNQCAASVMTAAS